MTVKIYLTDIRPLKDEALFKKASLVINQEFKGVGFKEKRVFLAERLLLLKALRDLGVRNPSPAIDYQDSSKPYLKKYSQYHIGISHSKDLVVLVISLSEVACDIEYIAPLREGLAKRFFTDKEKEIIKTSSNPKLMFYRLWTLKESYLKLLGLGLRKALNSFSIDVQGRVIKVFDQENTSNYIFKEYTLQREYQLACCLKSLDNEAEFSLFDYKLNELV